MVVTTHAARKVLSYFGKNVTSRSYHFVVAKMNSRSKRLVNLALITDNSNTPVAGTSADEAVTLNSGDAPSKIEEATLMLMTQQKKKRPRQNLIIAFVVIRRAVAVVLQATHHQAAHLIHSDDSVKDPNYEVMEPQNCSDSDEEVANNSGRNQDVVSQEFVIQTPTEDHEMVLDSLVQEADVLPIVNEPSAVENVTPTEQNLQNHDCSPNKKGKRKRRQEGNWKKNVAKRLRNSNLCEVCEAYKNSTNGEKERLKESYETHQNEKVLSRIEKENDKKNKDIHVAVYDLQAVFQCPKGDISVFYYKSK
ncbi:hypothetical protein PYW07_009374 [Mythimna separata]|uniref:Uncharacterized protein n=1 Tax=Mythimna separata TaxID=271217 RepID=A0AAD7YBF4_MYTSE|nr:hypothetical protein PYW07_009374 [Mythimna separata]